MVLAGRPRIPFDEYCLLDDESSIKHEYFEGQVWAMAGGSRRHAALAANVIGLLSARLLETPCQVHSSDLRIRVQATGLATYPDASVLSGKAELDPEDPRGHTVLNPRLVVEILSPTTEEYDRGEKLAQYQQIPSLQEVLLVFQDERHVNRWHRNEADSWSYEEHLEGSVPLDALGCSLPMDDLYRDPLA